MIVSCQSCSTKFQVPDEKVAGKRARLPCRKCGKLIQIDARNLRISQAPLKLSTPPPLPPRPSPFPEEAQEDWKVRFTDQTVTLARAEALALSMQAREDRPSHSEFSEADANMQTPASAADNPLEDRAARVLDFDDGEPQSARGVSPPPLPAKPTSRPPPPPLPRGDMTFRESSSAGRLPPPPPLPGARPSAPAPFVSQGPRPFEPPPIPKPDPQNYQQSFSSFGRLQSSANPFAQPLFTRSGAGNSSYPPPPPAPHATSAPPSYPPPAPSTYPAAPAPGSTLPPAAPAPGSTFPPPAPAPEAPTGPYAGYGRAPSNPQFPPSSIPPQPSGYPVAPTPPGPSPTAYAFGAAGPFSDPNVRYPTTDVTGASVIRGQAEDAAIWRRRQRVRGFLLGVIIGLASLSLALCAIYLAFPDAFYKGVDALRDRAVALGLVEKKVVRLPPGQPFATTQASQALDRAASLVQSCSRPEGPRGSGKVEVRFHRTGAVKSVELSPPFAGTDVGRCVQKAFLELTVPPYGGTEVIVVKPFSVP